MLSEQLKGGMKPFLILAFGTAGYTANIMRNVSISAHHASRPQHAWSPRSNDAFRHALFRQLLTGAYGNAVPNIRFSATVRSIVQKMFG